MLSMETSIQKDTKELILDLAEDLIHQKGYNAFSYKDLSTVLGIKNASIHYHFPSKEDLGVAVVARAKDKLLSLKAKAQSKNLSAIEELDFFFSIFIHYLEKKLKVGLMGTLAANYFAIPEKMQKLGQELLISCQEWLQEILNRGNSNENFFICNSLEIKSLQILAALEGALQMSRFLGKDRFYDIVQVLKDDLIFKK
jgi:AcrR family transcriptional regulator